MKMKNNWNMTLKACYAGYITQAIVNNFSPLLFVWMMKTYGLSLTMIAVIPSLNFAVQLCVDLLSAGFASKIGYRSMAVTAHLLCFAGIMMFAFLPLLIPAYAAVLIAVTIMAVGGGIIEVLISPITEACPTDSKKAAMSLLHSFYCWGQAGTVLITVLYFRVFGIDCWRYLAVLLGLIPLCNAFVFLYVPIARAAEKEEEIRPSALIRSHVFLLLALMMIASGASELAMSQWSSTFAEEALHISKTAGDLAGPCMFAVFMGTSRLLYSIFEKRIDLLKAIAASALLCMVCYLAASLSSLPVLSLLGCALCGFSVGIFWPGTFSIAAEFLPRSGTAMYALLALAGDIGCSLGPGMVGALAGIFDGNLKAGILAGTLFPLVLLTSAAILAAMKRKWTESVIHD